MRDLRALGVLWLCALLSACGGGASWLSQQRVPDYVPPEFVYIHVSVEPQVDRAADSQRAVTALVETLEGDLNQRGVRTQRIVPPLERQPPLIELKVIHWTRGLASERQVAGRGEATMIVDCSLTPGPNSQPTFAGRVKGILGGTLGGDALSAPRQAAHTIARAITARN